MSSSSLIKVKNTEKRYNLTYKFGKWLKKQTEKYANYYIDMALLSR